MLLPVIASVVQGSSSVEIARGRAEKTMVAELPLRNVDGQNASRRLFHLGAHARTDHGSFEAVRDRSRDAMSGAGREGESIHVPLPIALRRIFAGTGVAWRADPRIGRSVWVSTDLPFESALTKLVRENGLGYLLVAGVYEFFSLPGKPLSDGYEFGSNVDSIRFENADVHVVLAWLFRSVEVPYAVDPNVGGSVTVDYQDVDFTIVLWTILDEVGATYRVESGVYEIVPREDSPRRTDDPTDVPIPFVEYEKTDVRVALSWLFQKVHVDYRFDPRVKGLVSASLRNVTFEVALQNITRQVDATYRLENGVFEVVPRKGETLPPLADHREIDRAYEAFRRNRGLERIAPSFKFGSEGPKPSVVGKEARKRFLDYLTHYRTYHVLEADRLASESGAPTKAGVLVRYDVGLSGATEDFWDLWVRRPQTPWRLFSRVRSYPAI